MKRIPPPGWRQEFDGDDLPALPVVRSDSRGGTTLPWPKVQRRIAQLIKEDRFYRAGEPRQHGTPRMSGEHGIGPASRASGKAD